MIPFFIITAGLALLVPQLAEYAYRLGWIPTLPSFLYLTTWLVFSTTAILFVYLYRLDKTRIFVQFFLLSIAVKLIAYLAYNLIIVLRDRGGAFANVVYFLLIYFLYTAIEIGFLYRKVSPPTRP